MLSRLKLPATRGFSMLGKDNGEGIKQQALTLSDPERKCTEEG
jgi:hypothetical protein